MRCILLKGKWHLGWKKSLFDKHYHPTRFGFDYFFGLPYSNLADLGDDGEELLRVFIPGYRRVILALLTCCLAGSALVWARVSKRAAVLLGAVSVLVASYWLVVMATYGAWNAVLERNEETVELPVDLGGMTRRLVNEGVQFLERRRGGSQPFFLMMSWLQVHTALHAAPPFRGQCEVRGRRSLSVVVHILRSVVN